MSSTSSFDLIFHALPDNHFRATDTADIERPICKSSEHAPDPAESDELSVLAATSVARFDTCNRVYHLRFIATWMITQVENPSISAAGSLQAPRVTCPLCGGSLLVASPSTVPTVPYTPGGQVWLRIGKVSTAKSSETAVGTPTDPIS